MGETPQRLAKEASLFRRCGLSLRPLLAASLHGPYRYPEGRSARGRHPPPADPTAHRVRRFLRRAAGSAVPPSAARTTSWLSARHIRTRAPGRKRAQVSTRFLVGSSRRRWRRSSGAVTNRACRVGLRPVCRGLHRRLTGRSECPDHLHLTITALGFSGRVVGQHRPSSSLRIDGVRLLAVAPQMTALGPLYLHHLLIPAAFK